MKKETINTILRYAKQKTTWIALIGLLSAFGVTLSPEKTQEIITGAIMLSSILMAIYDEDKKP